MNDSSVKMTRCSNVKKYARTSCDANPNRPVLRGSVHDPKAGRFPCPDKRFHRAFVLVEMFAVIEFRRLHAAIHAPKVAPCAFFSERLEELSGAIFPDAITGIK